MNHLLNKPAHYLLIALLLWFDVAWSANQTLLMNEDKRLEANIALNVMNRIAVTNDRIVNIFGDDGLFVTQTDEESGQVFIKPTSDNGVKPLSITLTTENGLTQDLTLTPLDETAATLILKSPQRTGSSLSPQETLLPGFSSTHSENQTNQWISVMRQAVIGTLAESSVKGSRSIGQEAGLQLHYEKSYQSGSFLVQVWSLKNTAYFTQELLEKNFYQVGDLALSLQKRVLEPKEKTLLYVLGNV